MKELQDIVFAFLQLKAYGEMAAFADRGLGAIATVVKVNGSTYRRPGARMLFQSPIAIDPEPPSPRHLKYHIGRPEVYSTRIATPITPNYQIVGSLSGGCLESDVFENALLAIDSGSPKLVTYDTTSNDDLIWGLPLGCNGMVQVLIQPLTKSGLCGIEFIAQCLESRQPGVLATVFGVEGELSTQVGAYLGLHSDGTFTSDIPDSQLTADILADAQTALESDRSTVKVYPLYSGSVEVFIEAIAPPIPLVIFGAGQDALPVVRFAKELGWHVTVVDSRPAYATSERIPLADAVILCRKESVREQVQIDNRTVAVVMTHNYLHDLELLKTLLPSPVQYLGILGPKKRTEQLLEEILAQGITPTKAELKRLYAPIGIDIGAETPEEIALAIVAEIKAVLANRPAGLLRERKGPIHGGSDECKIAQTVV